MSVTKQPSSASVEKFISYIYKCKEVKDITIQELCQRLANGLTTQNIMDINGFFHRQCYFSLTNAEKFNRAEKLNNHRSKD